MIFICVHLKRLGLNECCTRTLKRFAKLPAFLENFRDLSSAMPTVDGGRNVDIGNDTAVYNELDADNTSDKIRQCIRGLQRGKSHGDACILNEFLIEFCNILVPFFVKMFNVILHTGCFPTSWPSAVIIPVFKKVTHLIPIITE